MRQLLPYEPEGGDGLAELAALLRVTDAQAQGILGGPQDADPQLVAADVEDVEGDLVAATDLAEHLVHGHVHIVEDELAGGAAADAQLVLLVADAHAGQVALHQKGGELVAVDLGKDGEQVRPGGVGDPLLGAIEHVVLAVGREPGHGLGAQGVRAAALLAQGIGRHHLARGQIGQVALLLRRRSVVHQRQGTDAGVGAVGHREGAHPSQPLGHQHAGHLVQPQAAVCLGDLHHEQAQLARLAHHLRHQARGLGVEQGRLGLHHRAAEIECGLMELPLLRGERLGGRGGSVEDGPHHELAARRRAGFRVADFSAPGRCLVAAIVSSVLSCLA